MSYEDPEIEKCTEFIDNLNSDNHKLKLKAVKGLEDVAKIIGSERLKEELIPFLTEIIEEKDNDDEFLLILCDQLEMMGRYL
mmetsp:Transcript_29902/g.27374  ORF Transcript_29902/g.27374 Transcript_29902/m.27374 type:complete len:82 (+) Transcript_29902:54-299(+)